MRGDLIIEPIVDEDIQSASVNFQLGSEFWLFYSPSSATEFIDPAGRMLPYGTAVTAESKMFKRIGDSLYLGPQSFALGRTLQRVRVPNDLQLRIDARSYFARLGALIHLSAGNVDPGWGSDEPSPLTLELFNASSNTIRLEPGMPIGQFVLEKLDKPAARPYGHPDLKNKYFGSRGVEPSRGAQRA